MCIRDSLSGYPLDGPVPLDVLGPNEMRSGTERLRERIKRENMTIRELYKSEMCIRDRHWRPPGSVVAPSVVWMVPMSMHLISARFGRG